MYSCQFSKKFPLPKNGGHFVFSNFCQKMEKHKFATIFLTVRDRAISSKFSIHRVFEKCTLGNFQKIFLFPHMAAILNFRFFCQKWEINKFAPISLTVRDRAISSKFSTHRVSKQYTLGNFQKNYPLPKNGGHFDFSSFCQKLKNRNFFLSPYRAISSKFLTQPMQKGMKLK